MLQPPDTVSPEFIQRNVSEKEFQAQVIEYAELRGFLVFHTHDSRKSNTGYPDLTMIRAPDKLVFAELKTAKGKLSKGHWNKKNTRWLPGQDEWLDELAAFAKSIDWGIGSIYVRLWRPTEEDWQDIEHVLK